jgi:hypothetical protein
VAIELGNLENIRIAVGISIPAHTIPEIKLLPVSQSPLPFPARRLIALRFHCAQLMADRKNIRIDKVLSKLSYKVVWKN